MSGENPDASTGQYMVSTGSGKMEKRTVDGGHHLKPTP